MYDVNMKYRPRQTAMMNKCFLARPKCNSSQAVCCYFISFSDFSRNFEQVIFLSWKFPFVRRHVFCHSFNASSTSDT